MNKAIFNKHGNCTNYEIIKTWGDDKTYYRVRAVIHNERVYANQGAHCSSILQLGIYKTLTKDSLDFIDNQEAISFHKNLARIWAEKLPDKDKKIILDSLEENKQHELF